jgi:hypothetical protein
MLLFNRDLDCVPSEFLSVLPLFWRVRWRVSPVTSFFQTFLQILFFDLWFVRLLPCDLQESVPLGMSDLNWVALQLTVSQSVSQSVRPGLEPLCDSWPDFSLSRQLTLLISWGVFPDGRKGLSSVLNPLWSLRFLDPLLESSSLDPLKFLHSTVYWSLLRLTLWSLLYSTVCWSLLLLTLSVVFFTRPCTGVFFTWPPLEFYLLDPLESSSLDPLESPLLDPLLESPSLSQSLSLFPVCVSCLCVQALSSSFSVSCPVWVSSLSFS